MYRLWESVPSTTPLSDLLATSLLVLTEEPPSAVLVRCSAGVEDGTVLVVHSDAARPRVVRMHDVDESAPIGAQAHALGVQRPMRVVAIPHITWRHLGEGVRGRAPTTVIVALLAAVLVIMLSPALSTTVAPIVAATSGVATWLLLRRRVPTRIGPMGNLPSGVNDIVGYASACVGHAKTELPIF